MPGNKLGTRRQTFQAQETIERGFCADPEGPSRGQRGESTRGLIRGLCRFGKKTTEGKEI